MLTTRGTLNNVEEIFLEITIIISVAAALTIIFQHFKQPSILAYILTGILLGPLGLFHLKSREELLTLGQVGITLSLFMLGLELKLKELRSIGKTAVILGILQTAITFLGGFLLSMLLGFSAHVATYIAIAVSFSSTIVIVKLLSDKRDLTSLHGKIAIGLLLVQDFFAVITIIFLTGFRGSGTTFFVELLLVSLKVIVLLGWIVVLSNYIFPKIVHRISHSQESLFLFSLAWVFALTAFVSSPFVGFSVEIGGFLAGLALANASENFHIVSKMRALRDFFITIFFVVLGLEMDFSNIMAVLIPSFFLALFVIFVKPFIITIITGFLGFRKRTSLFVGLSMGQISEFSLIIVFLGSSLHVVPPSVVTSIVLVALVTFVTSAYAMNKSNTIYRRIHPYFGFLQRHSHIESSFSTQDTFMHLSDHIIVIGADQLGRSVISALENSDQKIVVVDFNPDIINRIKSLGVEAVFGDISDPDIQDRVKLSSAKLVVSTTPDIEDNLLLIERLKHTNKSARIIVMSYEANDARILYRAGADYVILPHLAGGRHLAKIVVDNKHLELIEEYKQKDLSELT